VHYNQDIKVADDCVRSEEKCGTCSQFHLVNAVSEATKLEHLEYSEISLNMEKLGWGEFCATTSGKNYNKMFFCSLFKFLCKTTIGLQMNTLVHFDKVWVHRWPVCWHLYGSWWRSLLQLPFVV